MNFSSSRSNSAVSGDSRLPRAWSFKRQAQPPPEPKKPQLVQETYSVYNLEWEHLKAFLENKFPGHEFEEYHVLNDRYYFEIPEALTPEDKTAIAKLRKFIQQERRSTSEERN